MPSSSSQQQEVDVTEPELPPQPSTPPLSDGSRNSSEGVPWGVRLAAEWSWRLIVIAALGYVLFVAVTKVSLVVFSVIISLFLTAVLHPLESRLRRIIPGPKSLSALSALLVGVAAVGGIGWFVFWQISSHSSKLADQVTRFVNKTKDWLRTGPFHLQQADLDKLGKNITDAISKHQGQLISGAIQTLQTLAEVGGATLLVILTTFFMLRDGDIIWRWVLGFFPRAAHESVDRAARLGWHSFGGYMRGQVLIALFHGISITIVLLVLRVPLAAPLGVLIFIGSFIPLLGLTVTGALCVAVALLEHGVAAGVAVAIAIIVLVQVEGHVLQPVIMSRTVSLHPLAIALAVFAGTAIAGIPGALVSVPFVAFVNTFVRGLRNPLEVAREEHDEQDLDPPESVPEKQD
jgi:predicted PurR-regulated permease PerM